MKAVSNVSIWLLLVLLVLGLVPANAQEQESLVIYSGRNENLIAPLLEQFTAETGIKVDVLYGDTATLANQLREEGANSRADVFFAQDAGALGLLAKAGMLAVLPSDITERVAQPAFVSPESLWVGISGRARVLVYNPTLVSVDELPASMLDLTDEVWRGRVGWAPTNGSFQAHVTALRVLLGEEAAAAWLAGMVANDTKAYDRNTSVLQAVASGEVEVGLVNHYYLYAARAQNPQITAENHYFAAGDVGALVNIAGVGVLKNSKKQGLAQRFVLYLLGNSAQTYFAQRTFEYPLVATVAPSAALKPLAEIGTPDINLTDLDDLAKTLEIIEASGALD